jgi:uncharacterized protein YggE
MKTKFVVLSVILMLAVALSACGTPVSVAAPANVRTLNVNGVGMVNLSPDIAYIYIGVHSENASASDAMSENTANTQNVIAALKEAGIKDEDIRTTNFSIWYNQNYGPDGQPTGIVYMVDNTVYVTVRDLANLGDLLDKVVKAGANTINSIQFDVADKTQALKDARSAAVTNAKEQAKELADAASVKLGDIQTISFYDSVPTPVYADGKGAGGAMAASAVPIQPGQMTVTVTVSITYEIK